MAFQFKLYKIILFFAIVIGLSLLISGYFLNESFFLQYSIDKELKPQTITKIHKLQAYTYSAGLVFLIISGLLLTLKGYVIKLIKKNKGMIQNVLLLLGVIILFMLISECVLRILIAEETSRFGFGPGSIKFNKKYVHLNQEGFRDKDFTLIKNSDTFRILGLGDSFTYGLGIKNVDDIYLKKLEVMLNQKSTTQYEVFNLAKQGINTKEEIEILKQNMKYKPDMIILGYVLNDFYDVDGQIRCKSQEHTLPFFGFWLRNFSYLYYFLETRVNKLIEKSNLECTYGEYLDHVFESEKNREQNFKYFEELSKLSKENDAELIVVIFPIIYDLQDYHFVEAHKFIKEAGEKYNFKTIDLLPYYQEYTEEELIVNKYDAHPNELGHEIAAKAIYETLNKENYIKSN